MTTLTTDGDITRVLLAMRSGDPRTESRLTALVYGKLRGLAGELMRRERSDHTLQPTALVHEAFIRLRPAFAGMSDRQHLYAAARSAMSHVLCDHARARNALKRKPVDNRQLEPHLPSPFASLDLDIACALEALGQESKRCRDVIEFRYYVGLTIEETADQLGVSQSTVERDWQYARAWIHERLFHPA